MIWRRLGWGFAAAVAGFLMAFVIDYFSLFGRWILLFLAPIYIVVVARWGASRATSTKQGAVHGALTISVPAIFGTGLFLFAQYVLGGPEVFTVDHIYSSLILFSIPVLMGAVVGGFVGHSKAKKLSSL
jgi:hypothetical protein